jgi:hypothetical protein
MGKIATIPLTYYGFIFFTTYLPWCCKYLEPYQLCLPKLFLLETTWKQIRNETFKVHEME